MLPLRFCLPVVLLLLTACDSNEVPIPDPVPEDSVVAGVNLNRLLAAPSTAERDAVEAALRQRAEAVVPQGFAVEATFGDGAATVEVVSFTTPAPPGTGRLYGAVRLPDTPPGSPERFPVLVVIPEGEGDVGADDFLTAGPFADLGEAFVQVLLAPPGTTLRAGGTAYASEPLPDAAPVLYDFEVDLTRALLGAVLDAHAGDVDPERVGAAGFGRGGTVALLLATRPAGPAYDVAPRAVAALAPFTDYAAPSFRSVVRGVLLDQTTAFPGADDLAARYLVPLRELALPMEDVREALLRRSPLYFAGALPDLFLRHGTADLTIGSDHTARLADAAPGEVNIELLNDVGHDELLADENVQRALATYLLDRLGN